MSEKLRRNAPKLPVGSRLEGAPPTSHEHWYSFRRRAAQTLVAIEAIAVYCYESGKPKWKSRFRGALSIRTRHCTLLDRLRRHSKVADERGVVHRDSKPDNIKVKLDGINRLLWTMGMVP